MSKPRWIAAWKDSTEKPAIYHVISRVVERRFAFGDAEKEESRTLMRMTEKFSGCRVLSYCLMLNHFQILLEVPPRPEGGLSDGLLLQRLGALYSGGAGAGGARGFVEVPGRGADVGDGADPYGAWLPDE
jgi:hypothetical protein